MNIIYPVIHVLDDEQALRNAARVAEAGCPGVLLIQMEGQNGPLLHAARLVREQFPALRVGVNLLGCDPDVALALSLDNGFDMTWTDEQLTHSSRAGFIEARNVFHTLAEAEGHEFFVGVAFKHQAYEPDPVGAARRATALGMIATTSGPATGHAADPSAIAALRAGIGDGDCLAIASGITPSNAALFAPHLTHMLVATGISASFHEFDPVLLRDLMAAVAPDDQSRLQ